MLILVCVACWYSGMLIMQLLSSSVVSRVIASLSLWPCVSLMSSIYVTRNNSISNNINFWPSSSSSSSTLDWIRFLVCLFVAESIKAAVSVSVSLCSFCLPCTTSAAASVPPPAGGWWCAVLAGCLVSCHHHRRRQRQRHDDGCLSPPSPSLIRIYC